MRNNEETYWDKERIGEYNDNCKVRDNAKQCGRGQQAGKEGGKTGEKREMNTGTDCHTPARGLAYTTLGSMRGPSG